MHAFYLRLRAYFASKNITYQQYSFILLVIHCKECLLASPVSSSGTLSDSMVMNTYATYGDTY